MSTYLFAVAFVSKKHFSHHLNRDENIAANTTFRIWARKRFLHRAKYAATVGPRMNAFFEDYLEIPYAMPKQDMIAVPDFSAGAMENWGLITYREHLLLYSPRSDSWGQRRRVAAIVAHELAHQWFGNLVTMHWWEDTWLNEGFASYMEYPTMDSVEPRLDAWRRFDADEVQRAMHSDELVIAARPVRLHLSTRSSK